MTEFTINEWRAMSEDEHLDFVSKVVHDLHVVEDALRLLNPNYPTVTKRTQDIVGTARILLASMFEDIHPLPDDAHSPKGRSGRIPDSRTRFA